MFVDIRPSGNGAARRENVDGPAGQGHRGFAGLLDARRLVDPLLQKLVQVRLHGNRPIDRRARALPIGADRNQVFMLAIHGQQFANRAGRVAMLGSGDVHHQAADAFQHVDGRIVTARGQLPRQPDVTVEQPAHTVADRFLRIVAFDQHGIEARDAAAGSASGTLQQLGKQGKYRRRIAARGRRLAGGQPDLALRRGKARERIHDQQHIASLVAKILGDGRGRMRRACTRASAGSSLVATTTTLLASAGPRSRNKKSLTSRPAFADQGDDVDVGGRVARHHAQRHALADARAGKDADSLSLAAGQQAIDRADAGRQRRVDARSLDRGDRRRARAVRDRPRPAAACRRCRRPSRVDDPAQQVARRRGPSAMS